MLISFNFMIIIPTFIIVNGFLLYCNLNFTYFYYFINFFLFLLFFISFFKAKKILNLNFI